MGPFALDGAAGLSLLLACAILLCVAIEAIELIDLMLRRHELPPPLPAPSEGYRPFISVHVPIRAEPPEMVARTLYALAALNYAPFEVLVISNNTPDPAFWTPVERLCAELGDRFRFFDIPHLAGAKAGALNFALRHMDPATQIILGLDSDYAVRPDLLLTLTPAFEDEQIVFVQCPQDYRDWEQVPFLRMCYWEYWQFFAISMVLRTRRNATMLHGTMSLVRASAVLAAGGWAEWCLTEDSEMGIRLLARGGRGLYCKRSYGLGLMPFRFADYKGQRRRWVIGGAQQLRRHIPTLLLPGRLTLIQRLHHLQSWVPWMRDGLVVASLPSLIVLSAHALVQPSAASALVPLAAAYAGVLGQHAVRQWIVCRLVLRLPWSDAGGGACALVALTWVNGTAWLRGLLIGRARYFRTPKDAAGAGASAYDAKAEWLLVLALVAMAGVLLARGPGASWPGCLALLEFTALLVPALVMAEVSRRS